MDIPSSNSRLTGLREQDNSYNTYQGEAATRTGQNPAIKQQQQFAESFDALNLTPSKLPSQRLLAVSENNLSNTSLSADASVLHNSADTPRRSDKENLAPRPKSTLQPKALKDRSGRTRGYDPTRPLSPEELQKLADPKVKRLANVAQLCTLPINQCSRNAC